MLVLATSVGCGTFVTETPLGAGYPTRATRSPSSVQVLASGPPARPHLDVSLLEAEPTRGGSMPRAPISSFDIRQLKGRAAARGCDAIVVGGIRERSGAQPGSGFDLLDPGATTMHATCIVFTAASAAVPEPKAPSTSPSPASVPATEPASVASEPDRSVCRPP